MTEERAARREEDHDPAGLHKKVPPPPDPVRASHTRECEPINILRHFSHLNLHQ